ncbi:MAG: hypothetical protein ACLR3Q_12045 [Thomasclavelia ramosa]
MIMLKFAVFVSGGGTDLQSIIDAKNEGRSMAKSLLFFLIVKRLMVYKELKMLGLKQRLSKR